jgi:hypothetical protein
MQLQREHELRAYLVFIIMVGYQNGVQIERRQNLANRNQKYGVRTLQERFHYFINLYFIINITILKIFIILSNIIMILSNIFII